MFREKGFATYRSETTEAFWELTEKVSEISKAKPKCQRVEQQARRYANGQKPTFAEGLKPTKP